MVKDFIKKISAKYKIYFKNRNFVISVVLALVFFAFAFFINFYAGRYATEKASNYVNDLILNNIRVYDIDGFFIYGPLILWTFAGLLCLHKPKRIPFVFKSLALFVIIRSVFITLTHIGPFPNAAFIDHSSVLVKDFSFGGDLFFSGHTGAPFLMALIFSKNKRLKIFFTLAAVFFGAVVLMGHLHYSIDVLSAFFITYAIYHIAEFIFKKDKQLFDNGLSG